MTIEEILSNCKDLITASRLPDKELINKAEKMLGVAFGRELKEYTVKYGFICANGVELYGINSNQGTESDLIQETLYLHKYYPETSNLVAIENRGEGDYYLVDSNDIVYNFDSEISKLTKTEYSLYKYIESRLVKI